MDPIKEAFNRIKEDINLLNEELLSLKQEINELKSSYKEFHILKENISKINTLPYNINQQTNQQTQNKNNYSLESLKDYNYNFSIGNGGVPTDRQTNQQTNQQTQNPLLSDIKMATEALESLDSIKKEIRFKFKRLTPQEMRVFSTIYGLEDQNITEITYELISKKLSLSESSIRDYVNKLINKGIPIQKIKKNNKTIVLNISKELKEVATLSSIINLTLI